MSRRQDVAPIQPRQAQHAGLWLDKYIVGFEKARDADETPQANLVAQVAAIAMPEVYTSFYEHWVETLQQAGVPEQQMRKARVQGRLSMGLGGEGVLETAITLHRTYGMPFIPGSALKGLAANYAHRRLKGEPWSKGGQAHNIMFGDTESAGYLTFFDAFYVPGSGHQRQALWPDVITVHHPQYYQGNEPPADWDSPTPVPFLSATGDYLIAIGGDPDWVEKAFKILALALAEEGIGAKTSSGYGRMTIEGMVIPSSQAVSSSMIPATVPTPSPSITHKGTIVEMRPDRHQGRVRDEDTGQELTFSTDVIKGNFPAKKQRVEFDLVGDKVVKLRRI